MTKRSLSWLVVGLVFCLALPFTLMAQTNPTNPTLTLESYSSGSRISGAPIKGFSMGADNSLIIYLDGPFTTASPDISVDTTTGTYTNLSGVPGPASVTAPCQYAGSSYIITFKVTSTVPGVTFTMPVSPEQNVASFPGADGRTFSWDIRGSYANGIWFLPRSFSGYSRHWQYLFTTCSHDQHRPRFECHRHERNCHKES